ncbi:hypothetical protein [Paracoccus rhizosphaerae]|uniref:Uncharacterized protein n=1 Tax=Paracoccus rhizosphaerae TaxID=1133347 RepID=A0ABV6CIS7_9RHOB|nr:hypothetical protein [Paracoccus rhizosphaerae]
MPEALVTLYGAREEANAEQVASASEALIHGYGFGLVSAALAPLAAAAVVAVVVNAKGNEAAAAAVH